MVYVEVQAGDGHKEYFAGVDEKTTLELCGVHSPVRHRIVSDEEIERFPFVGVVNRAVNLIRQRKNKVCLLGTD